MKRVKPKARDAEKGLQLFDVIYSMRSVPENVTKILRFEMGKHKGYEHPTEKVIKGNK